MCYILIWYILYIIFWFTTAVLSLKAESDDICCRPSPCEEFFLWGRLKASPLSPRSFFDFVFFLYFWFLIRRVDTRSTPDPHFRKKEGFGREEQNSTQLTLGDEDWCGLWHGVLERRRGWRWGRKKNLLLLLPPTAPQQGSHPEEESHFFVK